MENILREANILFGNPHQWTDPIRNISIVGMERERVFHVSQAERLYELVPCELIRDIRKIGVIGINPTGIALAFQLQHLGRRVAFLPSSFESSRVQARMGTPEVSAFFERHGIDFRPHAVKALRGEQIHCQSGYCPFICEGRFIKEGN